jgi:hypothetical protein
MVWAQTSELARESNAFDAARTGTESSQPLPLPHRKAGGRIAPYPSDIFMVASRSRYQRQEGV